MDQFAKQIAVMVAERLAAQPRLVDRYALAHVLGVSVATVERMQRDGRIPIIRMGTRVGYDPVAVVAALSSVESAAIDLGGQP